MYAMNDKKEKKTSKNSPLKTGRECAYLAVFVALVIAAQLALSVVPAVEVVTLLFVAYSSVFGARRGMLAATAFSLLRQLVFGFYPTVLIVYLLYYNLLTVCFGALGKGGETKGNTLWKYVIVACVCTVCFTLLDNVVTPLWYGYSFKAARLYFMASLPIMLPQVACTAVTVSFLYLPLQRVFQTIEKGLS